MTSIGTAATKKDETRLRVGDWIEDLQVRLRTHLIRGAAKEAAPAAIVSRVPHIWIEPPPEAALGKRCMLKDTSKGRSFHFWGRVMPEPAGSASLPGPRHLLSDHRGRPVPAYRLDVPARTLHLFLDIPTVRPLFARNGADLAVRLAKTMIEEPVRAVLETGGGAHVGDGVPSRIREILRKTFRGEEALLREELDAYEQLLAHDAIVSPRSKSHIEAIQRRLAELSAVTERGEPPESMVHRQLRSLLRLVESRSCAEIRFGKGEIGGIANPASEGGARGRRAVQFLLLLRPFHVHHRLHLWSPPRSDAPMWPPACLGASGERILTTMRGDDDLYGMVDAILNYIATNRVGRFAEKENEREPE